MAGSSTTLSASLEDYLEAIFQILAEKQAVRAKEIARRLRVTRPSVTGALQALAREGLIVHAPYDVITLTPAGETAAREVVRRHETLKDFFTEVLEVEEEEAEEAACGIEHVVSEKIIDRLVALVAKHRRPARRPGRERKTV